MNICEQARLIILGECEKPTSKYGLEPYENHFVPVYQYATELAYKLGADVEVVGTGAWLHDLGSIIYGRKDHHITGAKETKEKLQELGCSQDFIASVVPCVLNHRGSQGNELVTLEEQIVAAADAMSAFNNIAGLFKAAFIYEGKNLEEAVNSIAEKLENKWKQLTFDESREIVLPRYQAAMVLFREKIDEFSMAELFQVAFIEKKLIQQEARVWVAQQLQFKWGQLAPEEQKMLRPRYDAAMILLS